LFGVDIDSNGNIYAVGTDSGDWIIMKLVGDNPSTPLSTTTTTTSSTTTTLKTNFSSGDSIWNRSYSFALRGVSRCERSGTRIDIRKLYLFPEFVEGCSKNVVLRQV